MWVSRSKIYYERNREEIISPPHVTFVRRPPRGSYKCEAAIQMYSVILNEDHIQEGHQQMEYMFIPELVLFEILKNR